MKRLNRLTALVITLCLLLSAAALPLRAEDVITPLEQKGTVVTQSEGLNFRAEPSSASNKIGTLPKGAVVDVTGKVEKDGMLWYRISYDGLTGYASAEYITLSASPAGDDQAFEEMIADFPESYKDALRAQHAAHPAWIFKPLRTGLAWDTVLTNECVLGRSLVQTPDAWKSYKKGAYDWTSKSWYSFDSGGWHQAADEVVAYFLDPRNFLDDDIYQFLLLSNGGQNVSETVIAGILKGTFMETTTFTSDGKKMSYAGAIVQAGKEADVSPYLLAVRIRLEQGSKGNKLAHGTVEGYENYFNHFDIGAWAHDGRSAILNGAIYAKNQGWSDQYKAILGGAKFLGKSYINVGQNTLYLQKYDVVDGGNGCYSHQYMTNVEAAVSECAPLRSAIKGTEAENSALIFSIPVYEKMPEKRCPFVSRTGSGNNMLGSLIIEGASLKQKFDMNTTDYEGTAKAASVKITATAKDNTAKISGTGTYTLKKGVNTLPVTVTAANGLQRTYTLYITSSAGSDEPADPTPPPTPTPGTVSFAVGTLKDDTLSGVEPDTTVAEFRKKITAEHYTVNICDPTGKTRLDTERVRTGDRVHLTGAGERTIGLVIFGDVNMDGTLSVADLLRAQKHILGLTAFTDPLLLDAADYNRDGRINVADLLRCQKKILGLL